MTPLKRDAGTGFAGLRTIWLRVRGGRVRQPVSRIGGSSTSSTRLNTVLFGMAPLKSDMK